MRRSLHLFFGILISFLSTAQGTSDALGRVYKVAEEGNNPSLWGSGSFSFFEVVGDTSIGGHYYTIIETTNAGVDDIPSGMTSYYFARDSADVLYVRFDSLLFLGGGSVRYDVDIPLIDYSLQVGDTMTTNFYNGTSAPVDHVDTVVISGNHHRRIWIGGDVFTEGYGSASYPLSKWFTEWHYTNRVVCITDSTGQVIYEPRADFIQPMDCSWVLSKSEYKPIEARVWQDDRNLIIEGDLKGANRVELMSISGQLVSVWPIEETQSKVHQFNLPDLKPGVYLVRWSDTGVNKLILH